MKFNLNIKILIAIVAVIAIFGGFYYSTQSRIDDLESEVTVNRATTFFLESEVTVLKKQVKRLIRQKGRK